MYTAYRRARREHLPQNETNRAPGTDALPGPAGSPAPLGRTLEAVYRRNRWRGWRALHLPVGMALSLALVVAAARLPAGSPASPDWVGARIDPQITHDLLPVIQTRQEEDEPAPDESASIPEQLPRPVDFAEVEPIPVTGETGEAAAEEPSAVDRAIHESDSRLPILASFATLSDASPAPETRLYAIPSIFVEEEAPQLRYIYARYPDAARRARVEGRVVLKFRVDTDGRAYEIEVIQALHPACDAEARRAVEAARFAPARRNGHRIPSLTRLAVRFELAFS